MTTNVRTSITSQIILGMVLGVIAGIVLGPQASVIGFVGTLLIQLIKVFAAPLVFFAIIEALITTYIPITSAARLLVIVAINATIAATIGLSLSNFFEPGAQLNYLELVQTTKSGELATISGNSMSFTQALTNYIPQSIIAPFNDNNIIAVIIIALLTGLALRKCVGGSAEDSTLSPQSVESAIGLCVRVSTQILTWLVLMVPLAVFAVTATTVGDHGFAPFKGLFAYVFVGIGGLTLQMLLVYPLWIKFVGGLSLTKFFNAAKKPLVYAFGTNSSLATLPLTLETLDDLGVSKASSRLGACVGTNLNNDGILLYEAMAVLFVAQAHQLNLPLGEQIATAFLCVIAAIGVAGVPEAGVVSLALVLSTIGLPMEILPLLLTVDWLIARVRSVTNVLSDLTVSIALDGFTKK